MTKRMTAAELMAELNNNPAYLAERDKLERRRMEEVQALRAKEAPLVRELAAAGQVVDSVWDLVNSSKDFPNVVPVLLANLNGPYPSPIRAGIARALGMPSGKPHWETLARYFRSEKDRQVKDGLAAALNANASDDHLELLVALLRDANNGLSRVLLVGALSRSKNPIAKAALESLVKDPDLEKEVAFLLRKKRKRP